MRNNSRIRVWFKTSQDHEAIIDDLLVQKSTKPILDAVQISFHLGVVGANQKSLSYIVVCV